MPDPVPRFRRPLLDTLLARLREPRRFLQVLAGPRQSGKTALIHQAIEALAIPAHYASADEPTLRPRGWIEEQWEVGGLRAEEGGGRGALLVLLRPASSWVEG